MGFISTGSTLQLTAYLTQKGRDSLLNGDVSDITGKYFSLGDSDANYNIEVRTIHGYVPDLTGDNTDCILSLANNVGIKHKILFSDTVTPEIPQSPKKEVRFKRPDDGKYYNTLNCFINLDSIGRYMLYHSSDNILNPNASKVNNSLKPIFNNLFDQVDTLVNASENPLIGDFEPTQDYDFELMFNPNIYKSIINTYLDGDNTINQNVNVVSPINLTFSSKDNFKGAGFGSIGIMGRELGYVYKTPNMNTYSFLNANEVENKMEYAFYVDENNQIINKFTDFTLATKINTKNLVSGNPETLVIRGDKNLNNISENNLNNLTNDIKNANQHLKLFKKTITSTIVNGMMGSYDDDGMGIVQKEMLNLKDFIQVSPHFTKTAGTNEYRTSKLTFNVTPKNNTTNVLPGTLNIVFKFNEDVLLDGNINYNEISDEGDKKFIEYDFVSTNGVFKNTTKVVSFVRNNCGPNQTGSVVQYTVPKGTFTGTTQAIADGLANDDILANGQSYANSQGQCTTQTVTYYSQPFSAPVMKSNCPPGYIGSTQYIDIPMGTYTSLISQTDANMKATNFATEEANRIGTCQLPPSRNCLVTGERILINENFDTMAIEDVKVGDYIYTAHEKTRELGMYKITYAKTDTIDSWMYFITVDGKTISCSPSHLFMVSGLKKLASTLVKGDKLMVLSDNNFEEISIKEIIIANNRVNVHKIEVDGAHTYITDNSIWHHNKAKDDDWGTPELPDFFY